jgi:hypothetical protein
MKKIISMLFTLVLVVYVSISFGNEIVTLTVSKANMQSTASINLYQHADVVPFAVIDTALPQPWTLTDNLITVNDVVTIHAAPVNALGQEGSSSPEVKFSRLPDGSDITIEIRLGE